MSERKWIPGDVATFGGSPAFRIVNGWVYADGSVGGTHQDDFDPRPLVVIDPEDAEQVKRLHEALSETCQIARRNAHTGHDVIGHMQAALREFVNPTPPKPDEPTGLGAVVEDAEGQRWTRIDRTETPWCLGLRFPKRWRELDAVRILSHGVTEGEL